MMETIIGIDPGMSGAVAMINGPSGLFCHVWDAPQDEIGWESLTRAVHARKHEWMAVAIEQVAAMPKQGVSSMFKFGMAYGMARSFAARFDCRIIYVTPRKWQTVLDSNREGGKLRSLLWARRRWPEAGVWLQRKKDHGRADALCIAEWARLHGGM